jgi:energy-converting hydrogenase Eha subunit B
MLRKSGRLGSVAVSVVLYVITILSIINFYFISAGVIFFFTITSIVPYAAHLARKLFTSITLSTLSLSN